jgi:hypothetical protein
MRLSERVEKDWFIADLIAKGVEVEYWDVTALFFSDLEENFVYETGYLRKINSYKMLVNCLKNQENNNTNFVIVVTQEARFYKFFRLLQKYNCKLHFIHWGVIPPSTDSKKSRFITALVNPLSLTKSIYYKVKSVIYTKLKIIKPFDVVFAAGGIALSMHKDVGEVLPINLIDYEKYISAKNNECKLVDGRYAVFLDINLAYQSDLIVLGVPRVDPEKYFASLNNYFDQIEQKYNIKVVIASHPTAKYGSDRFNGRLIFEDLTPALVKDATFVISHHSTSISYAILNEKPIVFVYTDDMLLLYKQSTVRHITNLANFLDATLINVDGITAEDGLSIKNCNLTLYKEYKYNYLTTYGSEHRKTSEIFTQYFT